MDLLELFRTRRSIRTYTGEAIPAEAIDKILKAGLLSPSGRSRKPWEFIVVRDKAMLTTLSKSRIGGAGMLAGADCAIIVIADPEKTDVWTEDCSIAMANMHIMAHSLGIGSCWIQGRLRDASEGLSTEDYIRKELGFPESYKLEAILSLGIPDASPEAYSLDSLLTEKIHIEKW